MNVKYQSFGGSMEAVFPADDYARRCQIECLLTTSQDELTVHLLTKHLAQPGLMSSQGLLYDAELAAFLGYNLDEVADEALVVVDALQNEDLASTATYELLVAYLQRYESTSDIFWKIREFQYQQRLIAELGTLASLGVISAGYRYRAEEKSKTHSLAPIKRDSFFGRFNIKPVK